MIKIVILQNTLNPINAQERVKINQNWDELRRAFSQIQLQINLLAGGTDVNEIIERIENAIILAETGSQQAIDRVNESLSDLNVALNNLQTLTAETNLAKDNAISATNDARNAIREISDFMNDFRSLGPWNNTTQYKRNNMASLNGNTYIALSDNTGIPTTNTNVWALFARRGFDGAGAVSTVNNIQPDGNGNIDLIIDYVNNLTSDRVDVGLSASSGRVLKNLIDELDTQTNNNLNLLQQQVETNSAKIQGIFVNVKEFGATGDGSADDTTAIQNAINSANSNGGGTVFFPPGRYRITSTLVLNPRVNLLGQGRRTSLLVGFGQDITMVTINSDTVSRTYNEISSLGFEANSSGIVAIRAVLSSSLYFQNLLFLGTRNNFYIDRGTNFTISDILVEGTTSYQAGISEFVSTSETDYIYDVQVKNYQIRNIGNGVVDGNASIRLHRAVASFVDGYHVNDLSSGGQGADGIEISGDSQGIKIVNSIIVKPRNFGIRTFTSGTYPIAISISNVDIDQAMGNGILLDNGFWINISDCILSTIGIHGINITGASNIKINNNHIIEVTNQGIQINGGVMGFDITNNYIEKTDTAILVSASSNNYVIANNRLNVSNNNKIIDNGGSSKVVANNLV